MSVDYKQAIVITGGKLLRNEASNTSNEITFQRVKDGAKTYLELNVKIRFAETEIVNSVRTLENFATEQEIKDTKNLIILGTKKRTLTVQEDGVDVDQNIYTLKTNDTTVHVNFDKNNTGLIGIQITTKDVIKTDHGGDPGKKDHCYIPF